MSIFRYRTDSPRTAEEIANAIEAELQSINSSAPVVEGTQNYAFVNSFASTLAEQQEQSLNSLYDAAYITDATGEELTKKAREIGVQRRDPVEATGVVKFSRDTEANQDRIAPSGTLVSTGGEDPIVYETTSPATINGPYDDVDSTLYSTSNTSATTQTTFTVDANFRDSVDVECELRTTNASHTAFVDVVDTTNSNTITTFSTSNTSLTAQGPTSYDTSSLSGDIEIEFQLYIADASATAELDESTVSPAGQLAETANVRASETGPRGNVGAGTVTVLVDQPAGIEDVTNPEPIGDTSYTLTNGTTPLTTGADREGDESLRDRALSSTAIGGAGTAEAVELALENIDDVVSADVFSNRSAATVNNVDPWHTEVRVYGGNANDIALRLYEVMTLGTIKTLQGGANGTLETVTITVSDLYGDLDIEITRPVEITLEIEIDVVHTAEYAGTSDVQNAIVQYIGGTTTDQRQINGLGQDQDVLVNEIENVAEDVTGVDYADVTLVDDNGDGSDDTTTDSDGVPVYAIGPSEVAVVDANDGDITVSETAR